MKKYFYLFATLLTACLGFTSCGDDEPTPDPGKKETVVMRQSTVKEGAEVDANDITVITLTYNTLVKIDPSANITLNGTKVQAKSNSKTAMAIDVPVTLETGMSYTLTVPAGAVVKSDDPNQVAAEYVLHFTTRKSGEQGLPDNRAMEVTRMLGFGWNLGNHFDSHNNGQKVPESWGSWWDKATPTEALYQNLAKAGVKTVRMPVTWGPWQGEAPSYTIEADYMALVKQNVLWAKAAGLNVVLNTHHDEYWQDAYAAGGNSAKNDELKARIEATWRQIAEEFKGEGEYLIMETFNELNHDWKAATTRELEIQNEWNQLALSTIRATGGQNATRWIAVPSYQASPALALRDEFQLPSDPAGKTIVAVHCYDPYNFTLKDPLSTTYSDSDLKAVVNLLNQLKAKFIDQDIPCYLGEFGCSRHETDAENKMRDYYLEYFCRAAHFAGLAPTLWDNYNPGKGSETHAYFSHVDGHWMDGHEAIVKTMIQAATSTDPKYTLESIQKK